LAWPQDDWQPSTPEIQGYHLPQVYRTDTPRDRQLHDNWNKNRPLERRSEGRDYGQEAFQCPDRDGGRESLRCQERSGPDRIGPQGRYARPDHNRRAWDSDITCTACKRRGHMATNCDMLAMALFLEKYVKKNMSHSDRDKIEAAWLQRWKDRLGNPSHLPCKVMKAYLEYMDISTEVLDNQMDWDCWPADDDVEDFDFAVLADSPSVL
jgi:hypothetical protein